MNWITVKCCLIYTKLEIFDIKALLLVIIESKNLQLVLETKC